jgi:hypothetical protein
MKEPVLKLDDRAKRVAAQCIANPMSDRYALENPDFVQTIPAKSSNVVIDRMPLVGGKP